MLSSCHCWTVWCCAQQQMMFGVAAVDEETVQIFGPRTEEAALLSEQQVPMPGVTRSVAKLSDLHGSNRELACLACALCFGPCCLLVSSLCWHLKLAVIVVCYLQCPSPLVPGWDHCEWSWSCSGSTYWKKSPFVPWGWIVLCCSC